jgi:hypothetical protein
VKLTTHRYLMLRLRVSGAVPLFTPVCFLGKVSILFHRLFTRRLVFQDYEGPLVEFITSRNICHVDLIPLICLKFNLL